MTKREKEIAENVVEILKTSLHPEKIILFGSRGKGVNSAGADFDFAVDCAKPDITFEREINEKVDVVSGLYKVDIAYLPSVDEEFRDIILRTGKVIYEKRA